PSYEQAQAGQEKDVDPISETILELLGEELARRVLRPKSEAVA
ncbi:unnamed protein product, partial [marine sediment metagenome]